MHHQPLDNDHGILKYNNNKWHSSLVIWLPHHCQQHGTSILCERNEWWWGWDKCGMESTYHRILKYTTMNLPWCLKIDNDNEHHSSSFGCHIAVGDMAPGFRVREISDEGKVSLLGPGHIIVIHVIVVPTASFCHCPELGSTWDRRCLPWCHKIQNDNECRLSSFSCHVATWNLCQRWVREVLG